MKNFEITFKNGLLIDSKTGNVLNLKPQADFLIAGNDDDFLPEDHKKTIDIPKSSREKFKELESKHRKFILEKIASSGDEFCFKIGLPKKSEEDKELEYLFIAILDEDLYIKRDRYDESKNWSLCNCLCKSTNLIEGDLGFPFEEINAKSLSELYANVVSTYFNKKRSTACNAFKTFYFPPFEQTPSLYWIKNDRPRRLDDTRNEIIKKYKEIED